MIETTTTKDIATGKISIALTKAELGIQKLQDIADGLVFNEDHLTEIAVFLELYRKSKNVVETTRVELKAPSFQEGKMIDAGAKAIMSQIDAVGVTVQEKYATLCRSVEEKSRKAEQEKQRKASILAGIDSNMISFSSRIANCTTNDELLAVERSINLEKSYKNKYQEFIDVAIEKYNSLTALLTLQKTRVKELEKLEEQKRKAEKEQDDKKLLELNEQQFKLESKIEENKITVQETAINQATSTNTVIEPEIILPNISTRNKRWTWEVADIQKTVKTMPAWTKIETVDDKIDEFMKASKSGWLELGKEEMTVSGIRFFIQKTY